MKTTKELCALLGLEVVVDILLPNGNNIPADNLTGGAWQTITNHDTANKNRGADARMHWRFVKNGGGEARASFTYCVDDKVAIQILRENQANYAQGTSKGNYTSISIERCINADADQAKAIDNNAKLNAALLVGYQKPRSVVVQHNVWYGKDCPASLRHVPGAWEAFLAAVDGYVAKLQSILNQPPAPEPVVLNGHTIKLGFVPLWKQYGMEVMGLPMSDEYVKFIPELAKDVTFQDFENVIVMRGQDIPARISAGVRLLKYGF